MKKKKSATSTETAAQWSYKHIYPAEEVWNTDNVLAQLIVPRLLAFRSLDKHGFPDAFKDMREWNQAIQKMIDAFELLKYPGVHTDEEVRTIEQGLALFCKHYLDLSD